MIVLTVGTVLSFLTVVKASDEPDQAPAELFLDEELKLMNKYRLLHAAPPLILSLTLTNKAELWASQLAKQDTEKVDVNSKFGQVVFSTKLKDTRDIVEESVHKWYNQIRFYDFHRARGSFKSAYFTQLVWLDSKEVGVGKAESASGKTYVVALFDPPGNVGNFLHSVLPVTGSGVGKKGPSKCAESGLKYFNNSCYQYFSGPVNWVQAAEKCAEEFSSLASINSQAEDYFVRSLLTTAGVSDAWIGMNDVSNHGVLSWIDGAPSNYMNFDYMSSDSLPHKLRGRLCGVIGTNVWQSKPCDGARGFVCKRPLRDVSIYVVTIQYEKKLWTDSLYHPESPRYQALKRHIEEAILNVYGDYDWFDEVIVEHFSQDNEGKIKAYVRLRFTPDDNSPVDPIQMLRQAIQGSDSPKRTFVTGSLHGEKVRLVNARMIVENQTPATCPNYCTRSQCKPITCSPWCCDPLGRQVFAGSFGGQPQQPQQHPGFSAFGPQTYYNQPFQGQQYPQQNPYSMRPLGPFQASVQLPYPYPAPQPLYPMLQRPQQFQNNVPPQPPPYQYQFPQRPQPLSYQVSPQLPQRPPPLPYQFPPRPPVPQFQFPQSYQSIARPMYAQPWPSYTPQQYYPPPPPTPRPALPHQKTRAKNKTKGPAPKTVQLQGITIVEGGYPPPIYPPIPRPMFGQPMYTPQQSYQPVQQQPQQRQSTKQKPAGVRPPLQLQGIVLPQPYQYPAPQFYQPMPQPVYVPQPYYQPVVAQYPPQSEKTKEKEKSSEKSHAESGHQKSQGQKPRVESLAYPFLGSLSNPYQQQYQPQQYPPQPYQLQSYPPQPYPPQPYPPQPYPPQPYPQGYAQVNPQSYPPPIPNPAPPAQSGWKIKIYRPVITIPRPAPAPIFNPGYRPFPYPPQGQRLPYPANTVFPGYPMQTAFAMNAYAQQQSYPPPSPYTQNQTPFSPGLQPLVKPKTCPAPCPNICAPECNPTCCQDRKKK